MSRKLVVAVFAFLLAIVTAWAEPGGDGGCVNLPGGRGGPRPNTAGSEAWQIRAVERAGVLFRLPSEMHGAVGLMRGFDLPFSLLLQSKDGHLQVTAPMLAAMRAAGESGFRLDLITHRGDWMPVLVRLVAGNQLHVVVE